jgi:putative nucleotidyltransferase with HDIG domain
MIASFFSVNFMTLVILMAIVVLMIVNKEVKIPATDIFIYCVITVFVLTIVGAFDVATDVSGLAPQVAHRTVVLRRVCASLGYILRPIVILMEILIIRQGTGHRALYTIPAIVNALIYLPSMFGARIAFAIADNNRWTPGPLRYTVFVVQFIYLMILLNTSVQSFRKGDHRKTLILVMIFLQAVLVTIHEIGNDSGISYSNAVTALCVFEYYIYLTNVYRQQLNEQLNAYIDKVENAGIKMKNLTSEVIEALASAIDAKDKYTHGHSSRVAEYSRKLAEMAQKTPEECEEVYYAALLHDVGKIGVPDTIITKEGKLTDEEYAEIKKHPVLGAQILSRITEFPYLITGAAGHHERYDGKGYPYGLKGTDIPEIARIIAVADAYDAMSSKRSYRDPIPQQILREELVKGTGTQFDPEYARLMLHLIDVDTEYEMCEREEVVELAGKDELIVEDYRSKFSAGILMTNIMSTIHLRVTPHEKTPNRIPVPSMVLFDSLDGRVHDTEKEIRDLNYFEYAELWLDGRSVTTGARKIRTTISPKEDPYLKRDNEYRIEVVRIRDHALIRIISKAQVVENIVALADSTRYAYIGLTGDHCKLSHVKIDKAEEESPADLIPRIAEEISYIEGPVGDMPNVQVDGYRSAASEGVEIRDGLQISFHAKNLPTARLVWHCPFVDIFCSDDGVVNGPSYRDLAFLRFDGEAWECDPNCTMKMNVYKLNSFEGWDTWKKRNQDGFDATVTFKVQDNTITVLTENGGIAISNTVILTDIDKKLYTSITGDQVALTDIRVS